MKLIASNQMTLTNLLEKAETRKETFYKLTNSADVPTAPSGGRNLIIRSQNQNGYINNEGGLNQGYAFTTDFIDCQSDKQFTITACPVTTVSSSQVNRWYRINRYDADKQFIDREIFNYDDNNDKTIKTITLTDDVSYFKVSFDGLYEEPFKIEHGNIPTDWSPAPEDLGWSTATLVPTQQQRYLWKFEYVYYSDGSVEVTQPVNISIAGADGTNGQTSHVHFAFADNATGGGFSLTTPKAYMGWYADFNESASSDPTKYRWGKWKGDQGVPGKPGSDGKTSYFHMAYADSADGKTGFSFKESGQQYQGYYTDFTQTSSTDPTKYTWMDRRAGIEVGGVNLLHNSKGPFQPKGSKIDNYVTYSNAWISMEKGKEYTLSAKGTAPFTGSHTTDKEKNEICLWLVKHDENINVDRIISSSSTGNGGTKFTWSDPSGKYYLRVNTYKIDNSNYAEDVQIEEGNVKTTYTRNPEDVQADIDSKADQVLTQEQLNALAEKNRNMEAEMAAKASLAEVEQWKQAYDAYVAQNDADKTSAEQKLITLTSRVAEWVKDWEDKKVQWSFLDTNMDFGEEGLRLGKKGSPTSILISNDRIGFYSGGSEVASMSNGTLTIDNGIFAKSLQIGHYREEVYEGDKTINVVRWID